MSRTLPIRLLGALLTAPLFASLATAGGTGSDFQFIAPQLSGAPGETLFVPILMNTNLDGVQGWSVGLGMPGPLELVNDELGATSAGLNGGMGPGFIGTALYQDEGFAAGVLVDLMVQETLDMGTGYELHRIEVKIPETAVGGTIYDLTFIETVGDPDVTNSVIVDSQEFVPELIHGSIEVDFFSKYCFGDGSGTTCPCGNLGGEREGCRNSALRGATLDADGSSSVAADDLEVLMAGGPGATAALLFAGTSQVSGGDGIPFGDGLRCAGGQIRRLGVRICDANGAASWSGGLAASGGWGSGDTRYFQAWYRDVDGSPCNGNFNLTHGIAMTMTP